MATTVYGRNDQVNMFSSLYNTITSIPGWVAGKVGGAVGTVTEKTGEVVGKTAAGVLKPIFPMLLIFGVAIVIAYTVAKRITI